MMGNDHRDMHKFVCSVSFNTVNGPHLSILSASIEQILYLVSERNVVVVYSLL